MKTPRGRKVWQHDIQNISEDQFSEHIHQLGWEIDRFEHDYGEDYFVRIFEERAFNGKAFFVQLKGTNDPQQYSLKRGAFSYTVDVVNLLQWYRNQFPVIFVLWDIKNRVGYWLHIQPYVTARLQNEPTWLEKDEGTCNIHIAPDHMISWSEDKSLLALINREYEKVSLGVQLLEKLQQDELEATARQLADLLRPQKNLPDDLAPEITSEAEAQKLTPVSSEALQDVGSGNAESWVTLAIQYYTQHNYEKALAAIRKAKMLGASSVQYAMVHGSILTEYAITQRSQKKILLHEAIALFETASSRMRYPEKATADYNIGNALSALGRYTEAVQRYDMALAEKPHANLAAQIWKNRGTVYYHLGNHEEEFASYQKALTLNPKLWEAYTSWAVTEAHLGNYARAKDLYLEALKVYPELGEQHPQQIYGLALVCWELGEFALSYEYVSLALSIMPDDGRSLSLKRQLLSSLWRKDSQYIMDALIFFRMWLQDDPTDMFVRRELYLLYHAQAEQQQASTLLSEAALSTNATPESLYYYACMLIDEGKILEAIDALEKAFQQKQGHAIVHKLAELKEQIGAYQEAIRLYKLILADNEPHMLQGIANCYHYLNEHEVCVWCCTRAILLDPSEESYWNNLVYSLIALDKLPCAAAVERLRKNLMEILSEETPRRSPSDLSQLLLEMIQTEFGESFVKSIIARQPPF